MGLLTVSVGQLVLATVVMAVYSWQLTLVVRRVLRAVRLFGPLDRSGRPAAYGRVRERVGDMLGAIAEAVVGAPGRAYGVQGAHGCSHRRVRSTRTTPRRWVASPALGGA